MSKTAEKGKLNFQYSSEGLFAFKSSVFKLSINELPISPNVGVARELLFPMYETIKESFSFLETQGKESFSVQRYKPKDASSSGEGQMLTVNGSFKPSPKNSKKNFDQVNFFKKLRLKFSKYENGEIYHTAKWNDSLDVVFGASNITVDDLLMGVGAYITLFDFGIEEYSKYGIGYRWFNVPSKRASFGVNISEDLKVDFRISKGASKEFLSFLCRILDNISEIFSLDENALTKFNDIKRMVLQVN